MGRHAEVRTAQSCAVDARQAVREFHAAVIQPDTGLVVFFCAGDYDLAVLAAEMDRLFAGIQVVGCTTAGEIGPAGSQDHSISGAGFPASEFTAVSGHLEHLQQFEFAAGQSFTRELVQELESLCTGVGGHNTFALLLIDGLAVREEPVVRALQDGLGEIALIGGSAGDALRFAKTHVYFAGDFHTDCAALVLVTTPAPFKVFKTQHFVPTDIRGVVTAADAEHRIVTEIDGWPAAEYFARLIGEDVDNLDAMRFAAHPMVVLIDGTNYVRSIQSANDDGSLTFFCAIEEGLVLRAARGVDLLGNLENTFAELDAEIGKPQVVIGCDCILRKLEIERHGLRDQVDGVFGAHNVVGFNSYGEQYGGVHINQTFTGIGIGRRPDD